MFFHPIKQRLRQAASNSLRSILISSLLWAPHALSSSDASTSVNIGAYYIPGLIDNEHSGVFIDYLKAIEQKSGVKFKVLMAPTKRVQLNFIEGEIVGYFPELHDQLENLQSETVTSEPFWVKPIIVYTRKGSFKIKTLTDLEGKNIGLVRGYSYGLEVINNSKIYKTFVDNDKTSMRMLQLGRLDVVLGDDYAAVTSVKDLKLEDSIEYDLARPLTKLDVFFVFRNSSEGRQLNEAVSSAIRALKAEGIIPATD